MPSTRMTRCPTAVLLLIIVSMLSGVGCAARPAERPQFRRASITVPVEGLAIRPYPEGPKPTDPAYVDLVDLNKEFRSHYKVAQVDARQQADPVLVVSFFSVFLVRPGQAERKETYAGTMYHAYKAIAHLPLGVYVLLLPFTTKPDPGALRPLVNSYAKRVRKVEAGLHSIGFPEQDLRRQRQVLEQTRAFLELVERDGALSESSLNAYTRGMAPLQLANADAAATILLSGLQGAVMRLGLTTQEWAKAHVLVLGFKMPREGYLQYEYFARVMGDHARGRRLLYMEGMPDKDEALGYLGNIVLDRKAALAFFADPSRMDRDILADAAARRLAEMFPNSASCRVR